MSDYARLRQEFLRMLTQDSETKDRRRKDYNQAVFSPDGWAIWNRTELGMVMHKFDVAVHNIEKETRDG